MNDCFTDVRNKLFVLKNRWKRKSVRIDGIAEDPWKHGKVQRKKKVHSLLSEELGINDVVIERKTANN